MPPMRKTGFIYVLDRRSRHALSHRIGETLEALGKSWLLRATVAVTRFTLNKLAPGLDPGVGHQPGQMLLGQ